MSQIYSESELNIGDFAPDRRELEHLPVIKSYTEIPFAVEGEDVLGGSLGNGDMYRTDDYFDFNGSIASRHPMFEYLAVAAQSPRPSDQKIEELWRELQDKEAPEIEHALHKEYVSERVKIQNLIDKMTDDALYHVKFQEFAAQHTHEIEEAEESQSIMDEASLVTQFVGELQTSSELPENDVIVEELVDALNTITGVVRGASLFTDKPIEEVVKEWSEEELTLPDAIAITVAS